MAPAMIRLLVLLIGLVWASMLLVSWGGTSAAPTAATSALAGAPASY